MKYLIALFFSLNAYATEKVVNFEKWSDSPEKRVLNLFPGFRDEASRADWTAAPSSQVVLYINTQSVTINRPAAEVDLDKLVNLPDISRLLGSFSDVAIVAPEDLVVTQRPFLNYRNPVTQKWCERGMCLNLTFKIDVPTKVAMVVALHGTKDLNITAESEVRSFKGFELDPKFITDLESLTNVRAAPTSLLVQNIFWFSHVMEFGKALGVIQPLNANQSVFTGFVVFAVERKWWDFGYQGFNLSEAFLGHHLNSTSGLRMGFPNIVNQVMGNLTEMIQR